MNPVGGADAVAERAQVADHIARFLLSVDDQDWPAIRAALDTTVDTDYTSLFGGEAQTQSAEELVAAWRALLPGFDATQHMLGPIVASITGDRAAARCAVTAVHRIGEAYWTPGGSYDFRLTRREGGWCIASITLRTAFVQGDASLPERATTRASRNG